MRGTLLNTAMVLGGATIGLFLRNLMTEELVKTALTGLGLVTIVLGIRMALEGKNVLVVAASVAIGGVLGQLLGISHGLTAFADWAKSALSGGGTFNEALLTTSILFCVGPMTLLGCLEDGLEGKIELLSVKSLMDGIASIFFAAALGPGVLVTAFVVFVVQGGLTLLAQQLKPLADDQELLSTTTATGGCILLAIGFGLANVVEIPSETYLPGLVLAPVAILLIRRFSKK
jgi:uncharacterized protein